MRNKSTKHRALSANEVSCVKVIHRHGSGCVEAINNHSNTQQMTALINTSVKGKYDDTTAIGAGTRSTQAM